MSTHFGKQSMTPEAARQIREEHARLKELLARIGATGDLPGLLPLLEDLRDLLASHFAREEAEDAIGPAVLSSRLRNLAQEILAEHAVFLRDLDRLIEQGREARETRDAVFSGMENLSRRLREHEAKEDELILDLAETDLGGGD
ncbi:MAG TPA: hemerythrin domain-containing protein [bacterium]|nr:hemerythrin domain-containing protein [bacterium]